MTEGSIPTAFLNSQFLFVYFLCYTIVYRAIARLNKLIGHKPYIVRGDCFNRVFDRYIRVYQSAKGTEGWGPTKPKFGHHATAWYTRVSAILKVLSLVFNTPLIIYVLQALMTSL